MTEHSQYPKLSRNNVVCVSWFKHNIFPKKKDCTRQNCNTSPILGYVLVVESRLVSLRLAVADALQGSTICRVKSNLRRPYDAYVPCQNYLMRLSLFAMSKGPPRITENAVFEKM